MLPFGRRQPLLARMIRAWLPVASGCVLLLALAVNVGVGTMVDSCRTCLDCREGLDAFAARRRPVWGTE